MYTISSNENKIESLKDYLIANRNDNEGDSWTFCHHPNIESHLISLNEEESKRLEKEIFDWEESELYNMADPISDSKNKYFDGQYLYGKIFLAINDFEKLEYLIQNLGSITWESNQDRPLDFYTNILNKVEMLNGQLEFGYDHLVNIIKEKIEKEVQSI